MKRRHFLSLGTAVLAAPALPSVTASAATPPSDPLPGRAQIVTLVRRVADQWIATHPQSGDNGWARATFFSGLMAAYRLTGERRYLDYTRSWAERHAYGIREGVATRHADNHNAIQVYLDLHELEPSANKLTAATETLRRMVASSKIDDWWWDDALHMAMPPFARIGRLRRDPAYWTKLHQLYRDTKLRRGLYVASSGLWYRDDRFLPGKIVSPNGKPVLWSRGNGWVAAGHVKTLKALPADQPNVAEYRSTLTQLVTALRPIQRPDGFWNVNLGDPQHLPGPETSGTAFFAYATAYAVKAGLVPAVTHLPMAARAWNGMAQTAVHPDGFLGYVQKVGDRPESSQPVNYQSTADFGVGAFLLAGSELAGLAG
ncbi:glycoside hydrolase family 88 protein [Kribbella sp. CA-293567]|uniref:glycoside hydrolase family 88 protein n=1 Tax=Kribbella sp. CA-293567 TaxID=3002436 RepID=UPI0022DCF9DF|nr:glycoside hydrolase family 88 protein [Kribbella sp. CA-293567]WBQ05901.1 glycoside hydrolase family 88 protein [Kribbella sp. CA-293567]